MDEAHVKQYVEVDPNSGPSRQAYVKFVEGKSKDEVRWWSKETVAVVTGGNKGIGLEIVKQLASAGVTTVLTARDESRGKEALGAVKAQGLENVLFHQLDVTDALSAATLASWIKETFGGLDILIGNAGLASYDQTYESAKNTLSANFDGQKMVTAALLPLFKSTAAGGRIVYVSSELGQLKLVEIEKLKVKLNDIDSLSLQDVDAVESQYLDATKEGKDSEWINNPFGKQYCMSKVLLNAYSRVLAKTLASRPSESKIYVNVMSPGLTTTDLNGNVPFGRTVPNAADTAVWLALLPSGGPHGGFLRDRADYSF